MADVPRRVPRVLLSHFSVSLPRLLLLLSVVSLHAVNSFAAVEEQSSDHEEQLDRTGPAARVRSHVHIGRSCRRFKTETTPELSEFGKNVKTIVLAGLGGGPVCEASTGDWRANLPRFLGAYTGAEVIIYDPRQRSCRTCYSAQKRARKIPCEHRMTNGVDLLLLIGSGKIGGSKGNCAPNASWCPRQFLDLSAIMQRRWAGRANRTVHFPIRNMVRLVNNRVFHFDVIIEDGSFAKPPGRCAAQAIQQCRDSPKQKTLVYIARIMGAKGQLNFIRQADAELLKGYRIEFLGPHQNPKYMAAVKALAARKGIRTSFPGEVSKAELAKRMCQAQGIITYSMDKNPRSIYEGVQAGLPVFVSAEAQVASALTAQPFVFEVSRAASQDVIDEQLAGYMGFVRAQNASSSLIQKWAQSELSMDAVYTTLCQRMGVCAGGAEKYDPWFGHEHKDSYVERKRRYRPAALLRPPGYASGRDKVLTVKAKQALARRSSANQSL